MASKEKEEIYIGLDIGSSKVCCTVGLAQENTSLPSIIGVGLAASNGVRKGIVTDVEEIISSITAAVDEAERIAGVAIDRATIGVGGAQIESFNSKGAIAVGRADQEISGEDLRRAEEAAAAIQLPPNKQILQVFARHYNVDDQIGIGDPVGMHGVRLEVDSHIITGSVPAIKNLNRSVYQAGVNIDSQVALPLASARAILSKQQKELGVCLVDIGAATLGLAVYERGEILYTKVLPIGSSHITNDIAIGLKTTVRIAEQIKLKYATANGKKPNPDEKIDDLVLIKDKKISAIQLHRIVQARLEEIMQMILSELKKIGRDRLLPGGVVLTGGGRQSKGIDELAKDLLKLPVQIGSPSGFSGLADKIANPIFCSFGGLNA